MRDLYHKYIKIYCLDLPKQALSWLGAKISQAQLTQTALIFLARHYFEISHYTSRLYAQISQKQDPYTWQSLYLLLKNLVKDRSFSLAFPLTVSCCFILLCILSQLPEPQSPHFYHANQLPEKESEQKDEYTSSTIGLYNNDDVIATPPNNENQPSIYNQKETYPSQEPSLYRQAKIPSYAYEKPSLSSLRFKKQSKENLVYVSFKGENGEIIRRHFSFEQQRQNRNTKLANSNLYKEKAEFLIKKKKYKNAIAQLEKAQSYSPKDHTIYYLKGRSYYYLKQWDLAKQAFYSFLLYKPDHRTSHFYLGQIYYQKGFYNNAVKHYSIILKKKADLTIVRLNLAINLLKLKNYNKAINHLKIIIKTNPKHWKSRYYLAKAYFITSKQNKALQLINQCLAHKPKEGKLYLLKGKVLYKTKKYLQATRNLQIAVKKMPNSYSSYVLLGNALVKTKKYKKALSAFIKAKRIYPMNYQLYYKIAQMYSHLGKKRQALLKLEDSLSIKPSYTKACLASLPLYTYFRKFQAAFDTLDRTIHSLEPDKDHYSFYMQAGDFLFTHKNYDYTQLVYRKAIESHPEKEAPYLKLAQVFQTLKKYRNAELIYQGLLQKKPRYAKGHRLLGLIYHKNIKIPKKAKLHLETYLQLNPQATDTENIRKIIKSIQNS